MNADALIGLRGADPWGGERGASATAFDLVPCADEAEAAAVRAQTRATRAAWRAKIGLAP